MKRIILLLSSLALFFGLMACSSEKNDIDTTDLLGSIKIEEQGNVAKVIYTFKNQSNKTIIVVGGANYKLQKDNKLIDKDSVTIKDYIDLGPNEEYTDTKTFSNLQPGTYSIQIEWNSTVATTEFVIK